MADIYITYVTSAHANVFRATIQILVRNLQYCRASRLASVPLVIACSYPDFMFIAMLDSILHTRYCTHCILIRKLKNDGKMSASVNKSVGHRFLFYLRVKDAAIRIHNLHSAIEGLLGEESVSLCNNSSQVQS